MQPASALRNMQWGPSMKDESLLDPWIRRFLLEHLVAERNLSRNTQASYRDTLKLLLPFTTRSVCIRRSIISRRTNTNRSIQVDDDWKRQHSIA